MATPRTRVIATNASFVGHPVKLIIIRMIETIETVKRMRHDARIAYSHFFPDPISSASAAALST
jgi:hypothetical protein